MTFKNIFFNHQRSRMLCKNKQKLIRYSVNAICITLLLRLRVDYFTGEAHRRIFYSDKAMSSLHTGAKYLHRNYRTFAHSH